MDRRARLRDARLYLCTGARRREGDLPEFLDAVLAGGVDIVQLREKGLEAREEMALAEVFSDAARRHGALFSVNDRADVARAVGADILHLGQGDLPVDIARRIVDDDTVIGLSTHAAAETDAAAAAAGVDYFCVGPAWATPTKPGRPAAGIDLVGYAATVADPLSPAARPWFAIGGIDHDRLPQVLAAGARRIVVVRAITEADDPGAAAAELAARLRE
ncbi:MAG TPA: thiamine phosphate synthase [Mycobacteriales bacterium]|nr:thiamine phosphate synthase [Mycobacteriales bacterium]